MTLPDEHTKKTRRWPKRLFRFALIFIFIPYLSVVVLIALFQRKLMYQPTVVNDLSAANVGLDPDIVRDVRIETKDGAILKGWLIHDCQNNDHSGNIPLVIYFPGNAGNRYVRLADLREFVSYGVDVLIFDYRGYGDSTGKPSEPAITSDAQLIWQFACTELKYDPSRIVIFGESLGGAVALSLWSHEQAKRPHPAAVILNSTFARMSDVVAWHFPWFPFQYLLLDRWPSIDRMPFVESPVIVFHGTADEVVPVSQGRLMSTQSKNVHYFEIPGGQHNNIPMGQLRQELKAIRKPLKKGRVSLIGLLQRKLMYQPTVARDLSAVNMGFDADVVRDVRIATKDGSILNGWLIYNQQNNDDRSNSPLVIYFPGNAGNRYVRLANLREIASFGVDVLIFDYRGYGDSMGRPSEPAITSDAQLIWQFACTVLKYDPSRIVIFGESLGGAVALSLWSVEPSKRPHPAAVILNSTFARMSDVVAWHFPWFPLQLLLVDRWRSIDRMPFVESPVVIFHGTDDEVVPVSQGRLLSTQSKDVHYFEIPGGQHNNIPMRQLRQELQGISDRLKTGK